MSMQSWGPQQPQPYGAGAGQGAMRAGHTDRDRAVDVLKAAYAEGRLSANEYSSRFDGVQQAKTYGQLAYLVSDLPVGPAVLPMVGPMTGPPMMMQPVYAPRPRNNPLAVASLVLGLLCVPSFGLFGIPAVVTGHLAKNQLRGSGEEGDAMATTGLVLGWLSVGGWGLLILLGLLGSVA
ncbi:DUF1707 and DUF4190 domain-containing protein [Kitasatospora sp. NBC_00070]|uniref:DUF1707 and DUF4190 domain-containing protein n=1 Tax=Kitasatospora sp. NBC_00070 TaxID=2975962 RepID=UPI0038602A91